MTKTGINNLIESVDCSAVSRTIQSGYFFSGLAPGAAIVGLTPNLAGMLRVTALGECEVLLMPASPLVKFAQKCLHAGFNKYLENIDGDKLTALHEAGVSIFHTRVKPNSMLYVPMGFVVIEKVAAGQVIVTLRSTVLYKSGQAVVNAKAALPYFSESSLAPKIEKLISLVEPDPSPDQ